MKIVPIEEQLPLILCLGLICNFDDINVNILRIRMVCLLRPIPFFSPFFPSQINRSEMEMKDADIKGLLLNMNLRTEDQEAVQHNLKLIIEEKEKKMSSLKEELISVKKAHASMIEFFLANMKQYFIPVQELGFPVSIPSTDIEALVR